MITIKLYAEKFSDSVIIILPAILVEVCKNEIHFGFAWLRGMVTTEIEWGKKAKIAANENKNK